MAQKDFKLPLKIIQLYHGAIVRSIMGYGVNAWGHRLADKKQAETMNRCQRLVLLRITGAYRTTSTEVLQVIAVTPPRHFQLKKLARSYWVKKKNNRRIWEEKLRVEIMLRML